MAGDVSTNNIRIGANIAGLLEGMKKVSSAVRSTTLDMNSKLVDSYKRANKEQGVFRGGLLKLGDDLQGLAGKMALIGTLPAVIAATTAYKDYSELEKLEKGLTRYGETIKGVREIAKLPNVGVFDAAKNLIGLKAMKMDSDLATRSIKAFANAITDAGGSAIDLDPALVNLKQFKSTRNINQVDVRQLANRIPQTMDAMQSAFGTTEAEKLNKIMGKIGTDGFIDKFITELEKIPPAAGGAATAQEQLGDSFLFFSGTMGKGMDAAFGITDAIKGLGGTLDNLSDNFSNLTPTAQKSVFALGALAVGMPVVVGAVGGLIKLLPILATGFGFITGPIAAVIAIVGLAAAAIITNWNSVKAFLTESTWWNTIIGVAKSTLGIFTELFKVAINLIQGDWGNMGRALVNIFKNAGNLVIESLGGVIKGALGLFGSFNEAIGFNALADGVHVVVGAVDKLVNKMHMDVPDSFALAKKAVSAVGDSFSTNTPKVKKHKEAVTEATEAYKALNETELQIWSIDIAGKYEEQQKALKDKIKSYKELIGVVANLNVETQKLSNSTGSTIGNTTSAGLDRAKNILGGVGDRKTGNTLDQLNKKQEPDEYDSWMKDYTDMKKRLGNMKIEISSAFDEAKNALAESAGDLLGNALSGLDVGLENIGAGIMNVFGDLLTKIGKALIAYSTVVKGMLAAIKTMNPWLALGMGVLAIAAGKVLKNSVSDMGTSATTRFAKGGMAYSEMTAVVGDNRNARFDPEMIAPYSKVDASIKKSIAESGGNGGGRWEQTHIELRGDVIRIALERNARSNNALNGKKY